MILILMTSRSGSSIVAGIFAAHGFDTGSEKVFSQGYETFENAEVNRWVDKNKHKMVKNTGVPCQYIPGIEKFVKPNSVVKTAMEHAGLFEKLEPKIVLVRRKAESIAASVADKRGDPEGACGFVGVVKMRMAGMERLRQKAGGAWVDTDQLLAGDFTSIREAFEHHGLEFNEAKARACVDPDLWHQW